MKIFTPVLKKSNSFNYYKNKVEELSKENKKLIHNNRKLNNQLEEYDLRIKEYNEKLEEYNNQIKNLNNKYNSLYDLIEKNNSSLEKRNSQMSFDLKKNSLVTKEINYALIFKDTIKESPWVKNRSFSLNNGAANYSFMYVLYRILNEVEPKNILELGLGQTTKLTSQYANFFTDSKLLTIDGDKDWIDNFKENLIISENMDIVYNDLETFTFRDTENLRYKNIKDTVKDEKFDLVVIDGPQGFFSPGFRMLDYSRSNIWELIPDNLADDFVIVIDDYERKGEKNTIAIVKELLDENNVSFSTFNSIGLKEQFVIASDKYKFISWY